MARKAPLSRRRVEEAVGEKAAGEGRSSNRASLPLKGCRSSRSTSSLPVFEWWGGEKIPD